MKIILAPASDSTGTRSSHGSTAGRNERQVDAGAIPGGENSGAVRRALSLPIHFSGPPKKYPADISPEDQKRLTREITDAVNADVLPAYKKFAEFIKTDYAPQGRTTLSITSLADGQKRYENDIYARTTTHLSADEIHQIGSARDRPH